ncbi:MAG: outer membrane beta-barrel protein [Gammaproteobacteria bacterium]
MTIRMGLAVAALTVFTTMAMPVSAQEGESQSAAAADQGSNDSIWNFYVGGGLGVAKVDNTACDALGSPGNGGTGNQVDCDDDDVAWKGFIGWQPLKYVAFEGGYVDLGETDAKGGATNIKAEVDGWQVSGLLFVPGLEMIGAYIRGGAYFYEADLSGRIAGVPIQDLIPGSTERSDTAAVYGMGFRLPINDDLIISADFERYLDVGDDSRFPGGETDINYFSLGAIYPF